MGGDVVVVGDGDRRVWECSREGEECVRERERVGEERGAIWREGGPVPRYITLYEPLRNIPPPLADEALATCLTRSLTCWVFKTCGVSQPRKSQRWGNAIALITW